MIRIKTQPSPSASSIHARCQVNKYKKKIVWITCAIHICSIRNTCTSLTIFCLRAHTAMAKLPSYTIWSRRGNCVVFLVTHLVGICLNYILDELFAFLPLIQFRTKTYFLFLCILQAIDVWRVRFAAVCLNTTLHRVSPIKIRIAGTIKHDGGLIENRVWRCIEAYLLSAVTDVGFTFWFRRFNCESVSMSSVWHDKQ